MEDYCSVCGYDILIYEEVIIDGEIYISVQCNECGADLGIEERDE